MRRVQGCRLEGLRKLELAVIRKQARERGTALARALRNRRTQATGKEKQEPRTLAKETEPVVLHTKKDSASELARRSC